MKYTPDGYGERCRFDAFCKTVLRNEARTHLRDLGRQRNREIEFSALSQQEMDKLCTCLLYTSDAADEEDSVDLGGCRNIKKKKKVKGEKGKKGKG